MPQPAHPPPPRTRWPDLCSRCGYPREGLSPGTPCPECGRVDEPETTIPEGVVCVSCGYHLARLPLNDRCPECGDPTRWSIRGPLLERRDPEFVARLARGAAMATWSFLAAGVLFVLAFAVPFVLVSFVSGAMTSPGVGVTLAASGIGMLSMAAVAMFFWGWRLLAARDPAVHPDTPGESSRRVARLASSVGVWLGGIGVALAAASGLMGSLAPRLTVSLGLDAATLLHKLLLAITGLVLYAAGMVYIREFALRIPDRKLRRMAEFRLWFIPVIGVGLTVLLFLVCLFFVGPIVAAVLYYLTIARVSEDLNRLLKRVRTGEGQSDEPADEPAGGSGGAVSPSA